METMWRNSIKDHKTVQVEIKPIFDGSSKRPREFRVKYQIDNEDPVFEVFTN